MKIETTFAVVALYLDVEGTFSGSYTPGEPAVMYQSNGDPGWPRVYPEFELEEVTITAINGQPLAEPVVLDARDQDSFWERHKDQLWLWIEAEAENGP